MSKHPPKFIPATCGHCHQARQVLNGAWFRWTREQREMSLREFARIAGYSAAYVSDVELSRRAVTPEIELAYARLCK